MQVFSERLKELREEKRLSMFNLSRAIGISDAAICKWENCLTEPKATSIKTLCEFFEVSSDYLLGLENEHGAKKFSPPIQKSTQNNTPSKNEQALLDNFRKLPEDLQYRASAYMENLVKLGVSEKQSNFTHKNYSYKKNHSFKQKKGGNL